MNTSNTMRSPAKERFMDTCESYHAAKAKKNWTRAACLSMALHALQHEVPPTWWKAFKLSE